MLWRLVLSGFALPPASRPPSPSTATTSRSRGVRAALLNWIISLLHPRRAGGRGAVPRAASAPGWSRRLRDVPLPASSGRRGVAVHRRPAGFDLAPAVPCPTRVPGSSRRPDRARRAERWLVAAGYGVALGLQVLKTGIGRRWAGQFAGHRRPARARRQCLERAPAPATLAGDLAGRRCRFLPPAAAVSASCAGWSVALLVDLPRARPGRDRPAPRRRRVPRGPPSIRSGRITFGIVGVAPVLSRLAFSSPAQSSGGGPALRSSFGDPGPRKLPGNPRTRRRDPSVRLEYVPAARVRELGRPGRCAGGGAPPEGSERATTVLFGDGERRAAAPSTTARSTTSRNCSRRLSAAAGIALENGRPAGGTPGKGPGAEGIPGSGYHDPGRPEKERQRLERNLHDGAQQRLIALSLDLRMLEERRERRPGIHGHASTRRARRSRCRSRSCAPAARAPSRRGQRARSGGRAESLSAHAPEPVALPRSKLDGG